MGATAAATASAITVAGLATGYWQSVLIFKGLTYCVGVRVYPYEPRFSDLAGYFVRAGAYGLILLAVAAPLLWIARRRSSRQWLVSAVAAAVVAGAILVVVDYSVSNGIAAVAKSRGITGKVAQRCPGDRPPWWPF